MRIKMTSEEIEQWNKLYDYVKKEIMQYTDDQSLPSNIVLRLKGLRSGRLIENNSTQSMANYSFETVLYTFKLCKINILNSISSKNFKGEMSKFLYIAAIVENNINDVYKRIENAKKSQEKTKSIDVSNISHGGAEYQPTSKTQIINKNLNNIW